MTKSKENAELLTVRHTAKHLYEKDELRLLEESDYMAILNDLFSKEEFAEFRDRVSKQINSLFKLAQKERKEAYNAQELDLLSFCLLEVANYLGKRGSVYADYLYINAYYFNQNKEDLNKTEELLYLYAQALENVEGIGHRKEAKDIYEKIANNPRLKYNTAAKIKLLSFSNETFEEITKSLVELQKDSRDPYIKDYLDAKISWIKLCAFAKDFTSENPTLKELISYIGFLCLVEHPTLIKEYEAKKLPIPEEQAKILEGQKEFLERQKKASEEPKEISEQQEEELLKLLKDSELCFEKCKKYDEFSKNKALMVFAIYYKDLKLGDPNYDKKVSYFFDALHENNCDALHALSNEYESYAENYPEKIEELYQKYTLDADKKIIDQIKATEDVAEKNKLAKLFFLEQSALAGNSKSKFKMASHYLKLSEDQRDYLRQDPTRINQESLRKAKAYHDRYIRFLSTAANSGDIDAKYEYAVAIEKGVVKTSTRKTKIDEIFADKPPKQCNYFYYYKEACEAGHEKAVEKWNEYNKRIDAINIATISEDDFEFLKSIVHYNKKAIFLLIDCCFNGPQQFVDRQKAIEIYAIVANLDPKNALTFAINAVINGEYPTGNDGYPDFMIHFILNWAPYIEHLLKITEKDDSESVDYKYNVALSIIRALEIAILPENISAEKRRLIKTIEKSAIDCMEILGSQEGIFSAKIKYANKAKSLIPRSELFAILFEVLAGNVCIASEEDIKQIINDKPKSLSPEEELQQSLKFRQMIFPKERDEAIEIMKELLEKSVDKKGLFSEELPTDQLAKICELDLGAKAKNNLLKYIRIITENKKTSKSKLGEFKKLESLLSKSLTDLVSDFCNKDLYLNIKTIKQIKSLEIAIVKDHPELIAERIYSIGTSLTKENQKQYEEEFLYYYNLIKDKEKYKDKFPEWASQIKAADAVADKAAVDEAEKSGPVAIKEEKTAPAIKSSKKNKKKNKNKKKPKAATEVGIDVATEAAQSAPATAMEVVKEEISAPATTETAAEATTVVKEELSPLAAAKIESAPAETEIESAPAKEKSKFATIKGKLATATKSIISAILPKKEDSEERIANWGLEVDPRAGVQEPSPITDSPEEDEADTISDISISTETSTTKSTSTSEKQFVSVGTSPIVPSRKQIAGSSGYFQQQPLLPSPQQYTGQHFQPQFSQEPLQPQYYQPPQHPDPYQHLQTIPPQHLPPIPQQYPAQYFQPQYPQDPQLTQYYQPPQDPDSYQDPYLYQPPQGDIHYYQPNPAIYQHQHPQQQLEEFLENKKTIKSTKDLPDFLQIIFNQLLTIGCEVRIKGGVAYSATSERRPRDLDVEVCYAKLSEDGMEEQLDSLIGLFSSAGGGGEIKIFKQDNNFTASYHGLDGKLDVTFYDANKLPDPNLAWTNNREKVIVFNADRDRTARYENPRGFDYYFNSCITKGKTPSRKDQFIINPRARKLIMRLAFFETIGMVTREEIETALAFDVTNKTPNPIELLCDELKIHQLTGLKQPEIIFSIKSKIHDFIESHSLEGMERYTFLASLLEISEFKINKSKTTEDSKLKGTHLIVEAINSMMEEIAVRGANVDVIEDVSGYGVGYGAGGVDPRYAAEGFDPQYTSDERGAGFNAGDLDDGMIFDLKHAAEGFDDFAEELEPAIKSKSAKESKSTTGSQQKPIIDLGFSGEYKPTSKREPTSEKASPDVYKARVNSLSNSGKNKFGGQGSSQ